MRRINLKKANVARADTIRDINRQIVLNYVREEGPLSRAEISHETELQRSTVSLIVEELRGQGLIDEIEGESTGGRPPILLRLRAAGPIAIGVDVSTTETAIATADLAGRIIQRETFATDPDLKVTTRQIKACVQKLLRSDRRIEGVGISVPGLVDPETSNALFIPYFRWRDWAIADELRRTTGLPVQIDNDANAAALAELWFGRPEIRHVRDFIFVLVEDGLGTGIVFDGQVYHGMAGAAGEFGHMTIGEDGPVACAAGSHECWEAFASERAALARYKKTVGGAANSISFRKLIDYGLQGEKQASAALQATAYYLGLGISNLLKGLSPEAVIIGGEISRAWPIISTQLTDTVNESSICRGLPSARLIPSTLGEDPRLMGAVSLVLAGKFSVSASA